MTFRYTIKHWVNKHELSYAIFCQDDFEDPNIEIVLRDALQKPVVSGLSKSQALTMLKTLNKREQTL